MGEWTDKAVGTAKEVSGAATGNRGVEAEGKAVRARGELKGIFERIRHGFREMWHRERSARTPA